MIGKRSVLITVLALSVVMLMGSQAFAGWYQAKIFKIISKSDGDVIIHFDPGAEETAFTERSQGKIILDTPGANKMLATILTAVSLDIEVTIGFDYVPSWADQQEPIGVGLIAR